MTSARKTLLLAIDLEEFYGAGGQPAASASPLPELIEPLLDLFRERGACATFFTVGDVARSHPDLVRRIAGLGHEIAAHGDRHIPLTRMDAASFSADLRGNVEAIRALGLPAPRGFRAPLLSLGAEQSWAHRVLRDAGFTYSSSVLPAKNPLHGWPDFGADARLCEGVWEIPVSVARLGMMRVPCFSGTYFRVMPDLVSRSLVRSAAERAPVAGYFHPYDFDHRQPWTWHAELTGRRFLNHLLFVRRRSLLPRLRRLLEDDWKLQTYGTFVEQLAATSRSAAP